MTLQPSQPAVRVILRCLLIIIVVFVCLEGQVAKFERHAKDELLERGLYNLPSSYGEPYPITMKLIDDGQHHLLLEKGLALPFPVRILQGSEDMKVPPAHAARTFEALTGSDVTLTFIKGGDHRLSTAVHLRIIQETVLRLAERADGIRP